MREELFFCLVPECTVHQESVEMQHNAVPNVYNTCQNISYHWGSRWSCSTHPEEADKILSSCSLSYHIIDLMENTNPTAAPPPRRMRTAFVTDRAVTFLRDRRIIQFHLRSRSYVLFLLCRYLKGMRLTFPVKRYIYIYYCWTRYLIKVDSYFITRLCSKRNQKNQIYYIF